MGIRFDLVVNSETGEILSYRELLMREIEAEGVEETPFDQAEIQEEKEASPMGEEPIPNVPDLDRDYIDDRFKHIDWFKDWFKQEQWYGEGSCFGGPQADLIKSSAASILFRLEEGYTARQTDAMTCPRDLNCHAYFPVKRAETIQDVSDALFCGDSHWTARIEERNNIKAEEQFSEDGFVEIPAVGPGTSLGIFCGDDVPAAWTKVIWKK